MEHVSKLILLLITLPQLCRAELSGTWYAANVINDGDFSPKPISEIFTTSQSPFSTANPIVVLPPSSTTASPPISTSFPQTFSTYSSSFPTASLASEEYVSTPPSTIPTRSTYVPSAPSQAPFTPTINGGKPLFEVQPLSQSNGPPNYFLIYQQAPQTIQNLPPTAPQQTFSTFQPPTGFESSTYRPEISSPQSTFSTFQPEISTPQSTFSTFRPEISTLTSTFSTFQPDISSPQTTFSTIRPKISTPQTTWSTFQPEITTPSTTLSTLQPETSTLSTFGTFRPSSMSTVSSRPRTSISTTFTPETTRTTRTIPCNTGTVSSRTSAIPPSPRFPTLRIRMVAPSGSITNINVNPSVATTTKRPITKRTTTTRKPTTTRTKRTKKGRNTFDGCTNMCKGRSPICAIPLAQAPIDPDKLKGFPSICHMACHNSFKKDQYEMLVDGRCGKLRTRIKTVDSNKLKRVELNKAQYTIVEDNPQTILEFSSLPRK